MWVSENGRPHFLFGGFGMTMQEASERYHIPMHILQEYRRWGLCGAVKNVMGDWQYDDADLERLSTIMTLHDIGFTAEEVETYLRLLLEGDHTAAQRLSMLEKKRSAALEEIHFKERQLQRLDYLRHEIRKAQGGKKG
jgi:DNA-binding transcriptional MerR regulator